MNKTIHLLLQIIIQCIFLKAIREQLLLTEHSFMRGAGPSPTNHRLGNHVAINPTLVVKFIGDAHGCSPYT